MSFSRNPLKSGQGFNEYKMTLEEAERLCRNPLKSGQGFNHRESDECLTTRLPTCRNPLKSGQGFNPIEVSMLLAAAGS